MCIRGKNEGGKSGGGVTNAEVFIWVPLRETAVSRLRMFRCSFSQCYSCFAALSDEIISAYDISYYCASCLNPSPIEYLAHYFKRDDGVVVDMIASGAPSFNLPLQCLSLSLSFGTRSW